MYEEYRLKEMRRVYSRQGWSLLIYYGILNAAVMLVMMVDAIYQSVLVVMTGQNMDLQQMTQILEANSGWGYFLAIGIGLLILLLWKKPRYVSQTLWKPGKPMKVGSFFALLAIFTSAQLGIQLLYMGLELLANSLGYSMAQAMEGAGGSMDSLSMFLYVGVGAPISEELLFRGLIMRSMEPYGKKYAIFASALLFGIYHGNLVQIPFAFAVGLVLGYVTVEYNIGWAIVLHMFNNLILSDTMTRLMNLAGFPWSELWFWLLIIVCAIATVSILIVKWRSVKLWWNQYRDDPRCALAFVSAPGIIVLILVMTLLTLVSTFLMMTPIG